MNEFTISLILQSLVTMSFNEPLMLLTIVECLGQFYNNFGTMHLGQLV